MKPKRHPVRRFSGFWGITAIILFVALLGYIFIATLTPGFAKILFYVYFAFALVLSTIGFLQMKWDKAANWTSKDTLKESLTKAARESRLFVRLRNESGEFSRFLTKHICWIVEVCGSVLGYRAYRMASRTSSKKLDKLLYLDAVRNSEHHYSLFALSVAVLFFVISFIGIDSGWYSYLFVLVITLSVSLRHISYFIGPAELPIRLRRTTKLPYLVFLGILLADFLTLLLVGALFNTGKDPSDLLLSDFSDALSSVFAFRKFYRLLLGDDFSLKEIAIGLAGLFFYLGFLRYVLRLKAFSKNEEDIQWLANRHMEVGKFGPALTELERIHEITESTKLIKVGALVGINRLEEAAKLSEIYLVDVGDPVTTDGVFGTMAVSTQFFPIPDHSVISLLKWAVAKKVSDIILMDVLGSAMSESQTLQQTAAGFLENRQHHYPLTYCHLLTLAEKWSEAETILDKAVTGSELEEISRLTMKLQVSVWSTLSSQDKDAREKAAAILNSWMDESFPHVRDLISCLDPDECLAAVAQLLGLQLSLSIVGSGREQEIAFLIDDRCKHLEKYPGAAYGLKALKARSETMMKRLL